MAITLKDLYGGMLTVQNQMNLYHNLPAHKKKFEMYERIVIDLDLTLSFPFMQGYNFAERINWLTKQGCSEVVAALVLQLKTSANTIAFHTDSDIRCIPHDTYESIEHGLGVVCRALSEIGGEQAVAEVTKPA